MNEIELLSSNLVNIQANVLNKVVVHIIYKSFISFSSVFRQHVWMDIDYLFIDKVPNLKL